jgi:hypothetical protein
MSIIRFRNCPYTRACAKKRAKLRASDAGTGSSVKPVLYNATDFYPIGLLHSTFNAIFPGLLIRIADAEQEMGHLCF